MSNWYTRITTNLAVIPDFISHCENELLSAKSEVKVYGNVEKNILTSARTSIVFQRKNIKILDLKLGDSVVVIGEPDNSGQIMAELIRVMPQNFQQN